MRYVPDACHVQLISMCAVLVWLWLCWMRSCPSSLAPVVHCCPPAEGKSNRWVTPIFLDSDYLILRYFKLRALASVVFCLEQLWERSPSRSCILQVMRTLVPCHHALPSSWAPWPWASCVGCYLRSVSSCWIRYPSPATVAAGRAMTATDQAEPVVVSPGKCTKGQRCWQTAPFKNHWCI